MRRLLLLAVLALACARGPAPSPDYAEARRRHAELVAAGDDAPLRPEMDEVLALLGRVPADSADAPAAAELRARIEADRKAAAEDRARRAAAVDRASAPQPFPAGALAPPAPLKLARGAKVAELQEQGGGCFAKKTDVELVEGDRTRNAEAWELAADPACQERFAAQKGQWLLFAEGAFVSAQPAASATTVTRTTTLPAPVPVPPPARPEAKR